MKRTIFIALALAFIFTVAADKPAALSAGTDKVKIISKGEEVDIKKFLEKDRVVIFDFYADWCPPCRTIGPKLEELVKKYDDVVLRKINIDNWRSAVAKQYNMRSIPSIWVYNKKGVMAGKPSGDYNSVLKNVESARK